MLSNLKQVTNTRANSPIPLNPRRAFLLQVAGEQEKLGKKINKKVMGMFEKAEQEYQEVSPQPQPPKPYPPPPPTPKTDEAGSWARIPKP